MRRTRMNRFTRTVGLLSLALLGLFVICTAPTVGDEPQPKLDVPYEPTHPEVVKAMLNLAKVTDKDIVYDLGCGDGRIVIMAAKEFGARGVGMDIDPQRIKEAKENAEHAGVSDRVEFKVEDIMTTDISEATVVTMYLLNRVNLMIRPKLFRELKPGTRVVSHAFHMADWETDKIVRHPKARNKLIHFWVMPAPVGGRWRWTTKTPQGKSEYTLELEQEFQTVGGVLSSPGAGKIRVDDVSLTGRELRLSATMPVGRGRVKVVCQGRAEGDTIEGTQEWLGGPYAGKHTWVAKRSPANIAGDWQFGVKPNARRLDGLLRVEGKGKTLRGTYLFDKDKREIALPALYVWGASIRFEIPDGDSPLIFTGSLDGSAGAGRIVREGWVNELQWSAKRMK